jgi:hypothetical protein
MRHIGRLPCAANEHCALHATALIVAWNDVSSQHQDDELCIDCLPRSFAHLELGGTHGRIIPAQRDEKLVRLLMTESIHREY